MTFPTLKLKSHTYSSEIRKESDAEFEEVIRFTASLDGDSSSLSDQDYQLLTDLCAGKPSGPHIPQKCVETPESTYCQARAWKAGRVRAIIQRHSLSQEDLWKSAEPYRDEGTSRGQEEPNKILGVGILIACGLGVWAVAATSSFLLNGMAFSFQPQAEEI